MAFSAALIDSRNWTNFGPYADDETLKLKKVIANIGEAYNPETGMIQKVCVILFSFVENNPSIQVLNLDWAD